MLPAEVPAPHDNPTSKEKVALGQRLFFDARLSGKNDMSCATCHQPQKAFTDGVALGKGYEGKILTRNTPSLLNAAFYKALTWDGRAKSLEEQSLQPIIAPTEMNQDLTELERELNEDRSYAEQFQKVFGSRPNRQSVAQALAAFERTLNTQPSPFDHRQRLPPRPRQLGRPPGAQTRRRTRLAHHLARPQQAPPPAPRRHSHAPKLWVILRAVALDYEGSV